MRNMSKRHNPLGMTVQQLQKIRNNSKPRKILYNKVQKTYKMDTRIEKYFSRMEWYGRTETGQQRRPIVFNLSACPSVCNSKTIWSRTWLVSAI